MTTVRILLVGPSPTLGVQGVSETVSFDARIALDFPVVGFITESVTADGDWWRKECTRLLARGGRIVLLCGRNPGPGLQTEFVQWLTNYAGIPIQRAGGPFTIKCLTPELRRLLENDLAYHYFGTCKEGVRHLAVVARSEEMTVAAIAEVDRGQVAVLPTGITHNTVDHLVNLVQAIPLAEEYPDYLDALETHEEVQVRVDLAELRERTKQLEAELDAARRRKRILYVGSFELEVEVVEFLTSELEIPARHVPGLGEDFWLTDNDHDWAIGEVKSSGKGNVDKIAVGQLLNHRKEAGRPEDFPALLVANTYYKRSSLKERDEDIHGDVARRAQEDNILVVRTLDLFRMRQQCEARAAFIETLWQRGGWFQVNDNLSWSVSPT